MKVSNQKTRKWLDAIFCSSDYKTYRDYFKSAVLCGVATLFLVLMRIPLWPPHFILTLCLFITFSQLSLYFYYRWRAKHNRAGYERIVDLVAGVWILSGLYAYLFMPVFPQLDIPQLGLKILFAIAMTLIGMLGFWFIGCYFYMRHRRLRKSTCETNGLLGMLKQKETNG